ncbi:hypothetical protein WMF39_33715 [Sorangium sp. So ce1504]|uniref:hypothetical protein n=1 Tax=Sorangium sp. So ce1504 TaxID=3133337 RepID=UPI003F62F245
MIQQIRLVLASLVASATIAGCVMSADPAGEAPAGEEGELVESAQQPLPSSGYFRTYYSDASYTTVVGWVNWECDPNYREADGETSRYYKQRRFDCPTFDNPLLPACDLCNTYTTSDGHTFTNCSLIACPRTSW